MALFTKQQLIDYVESKGFTGDFDDWYDWYLRNNFTYKKSPSSKTCKPIVNWKNMVMVQIRYGKFNARLHKKEPKLTEEQIKRNLGL